MIRSRFMSSRTSLWGTERRGDVWKTHNSGPQSPSEHVVPGRVLTAPVKAPGNRIEFLFWSPGVPGMGWTEGP